MSYQVKFHRDAGKEIITVYLNNKPLFFSLIEIFDSFTTCNHKDQIISLVKNRAEDYVEETVIDKQIAFRMGKNVFVFLEISGKMIKIAKIAVMKK